jgi:hypothetical protein
MIPIVSEILSKQNLTKIYYEIDEIYSNNRKLMICIKNTYALAKELGITACNCNEISYIMEELEKYNNEIFFRKVCLNTTNMRSVEKLRRLCDNINKYENKLCKTFKKLDLTLNTQNLFEISRIIKKNNIDDEFGENDCENDCKKITLRTFLEIYSYKEETLSIFQKLVQNSIQCVCIKGSMENISYYKGFNYTH